MRTMQTILLSVLVLLSGCGFFIEEFEGNKISHSPDIFESSNNDENEPENFTRRSQEIESESCHKDELFGWSYCTKDCPCLEGEGDCDRNSDCADGLICKHNVGAKYGRSSGLDVCEKPDTQTSCHDGTKFGWSYCTKDCPCDVGKGDCDNDSECKSGLICRHDVGEKYGVSPQLDVCEKIENSTPTPAPSSSVSTIQVGQCVLNQFEKGALDLLNRVRAENGLSIVKCDPNALSAARIHSKDMCDNQYFSHSSLNGDSAGDRLKRSGVAWRSWGENIAAGQRTSQNVHDGWMNSDGHRKNMLNPAWTYVGIGYVDCPQGRYSTYWTEAFFR